MKFHPNLPVKIASIVLVLALVLGAGTTLFATYKKHVEGPFIQAVAGWLPAAKVGSKIVTYGEYLDHVNAASRFIATQGPLNGVSGTMTDDDRKAALDRTIRIAAVKEMADQKKVTVTPLDIDRALDQTIQQAGASTTITEFRDYLAEAYGWTEDDFKTYILGPAILEDAVKQSYVRDGKTEEDFNKDLETAMGEPNTKRYLTF